MVGQAAGWRVPHQKRTRGGASRDRIREENGPTLKNYIPGRGQWAIRKAHGLGGWLPLHFGGALA